MNVLVPAVIRNMNIAVRVGLSEHVGTVTLTILQPMTVPFAITKITIHFYLILSEILPTILWTCSPCSSMVVAQQVTGLTATHSRVGDSCVRS